MPWAEWQGSREEFKKDDRSAVKSMLGPTGNLRAPTLRAGKTPVSIVFFSELVIALYGHLA